MTFKNKNMIHFNLKHIDWGDGVFALFINSKLPKIYNKQKEILVQS
jgi:hypothetical protein